MAEHKNEHDLSGMKVAILVTDLFEKSELTSPQQALEQAGATTHIIAPKAGQVQAWEKGEKAEKFNVDRTLDEADPQEYDAVLLPGGTYNADKLRMEPKAQAFVKKIDAQNKPIAVICHAPWLLVSAGLVKGRKMTSYQSLQDDLRNAGAHWEDREVVIDRNWVSSRKPDDLPVFNREMVKLFAQQKQGTQETAQQGRGNSR